MGVPCSPLTVRIAPIGDPLFSASPFAPTLSGLANSGSFFWPGEALCFGLTGHLFAQLSKKTSRDARCTRADGKGVAGERKRGACGLLRVEGENPRFRLVLLLRLIFENWFCGPGVPIIFGGFKHHAFGPVKVSFPWWATFFRGSIRNLPTDNDLTLASPTETQATWTVFSGG